MDRAAAAMEEQSALFLATDKISTMSDLNENLDRLCVPTDVIEKSSDTVMSFYFVVQDEQKKPSVAFCLSVEATLAFTMWSNDVKVPRNAIAHITKSDTFSSCSEVLNTLSFLKNRSEQQCTPPKDAIQQCVSLLESILPELQQEDSIIHSKIAFLTEQLELSLLKPKQRRYSAFLLASATMWQTTSTALYKQMYKSTLLNLPSVDYLQRLRSALSVETGLSTSTKNYLTARIANLSENNRLVSVLIDEVYSAKRIEFSGGKFYGLENAEATKTLLCFMVSSVAGSYRDMVAMMPIVKIDASVILSNFEKVVEALQEIGFQVTSVLTDGHSANRRFYSEKLCGGNLASSAPNPHFPGEKIFLLFDPTHLFKNYYSNFFNKKIFSCPDFDDQKVQPNFQHIKDLYEKELRKPVKIAHKLVQKVISPRPIERCNVMLAERLFHESTIAGLEFYVTRGHPEWEKTANFLRLIRNWWNIVSVRTLSIGPRKRDDSKRAISASQCDQLAFLDKFCDWLEQWKCLKEKKTSLSSETFLCAMQTSSTLPKVARMLLEEKNLSFVLLGKFSSDPIEKRFGHYRQLAGANYFLSVRQFVESEKIIRLRALVKFSQLNIAQVREVFEPVMSEQKEQCETDVEVILDMLGNDGFSENITCDESDEAVIYYVSGYIARSLVKLLSCKHCGDVLTQSDESLQLQFDTDIEEDDDRKSALIEQVNRGGLVIPSDLVYVFCLHAFAFFQEIFDEGEVQQLLLSFGNPRKVFVQGLLRRISGEDNSSSLLSVKCESQHDMLPVLTKVSARFFNVMSKNFISKINDALHLERKRGTVSETSQKRKISKLSD
jgi:hypothetical protein